MKYLVFVAIMAIYLANAIHLQHYDAPSLQSYIVKTGGNSYPLDSASDDMEQTNITFKSFPTSFSTYFYTSTRSAAPENIYISISMNCSVSTNVTVALGNISITVAIPAKISYKEVKVGKFKSNYGYNKIITTISSKYSGQGSVYYLNITGRLTNFTMVYNDTNLSDTDFLWGKRGASAYLTPNDIDEDNKCITYFYSEITIPKGFDTRGCYFMTNGFSKGYMGFQYGEDSKKFIFSVWSPHQTDNAKEIPYEDMVNATRIGPGVEDSSFGGEGSGGSLKLPFEWQTDVTYKVLNKIRANQTANSSTYTAWINDPNNSTNGGWRLIGEMIRPKTVKNITEINSFIENYLPDYGNTTKMAYYGNQWYYDESNSTGVWKESVKYQFSFSKGRFETRKDVNGYLKDDKYFVMATGGYFTVDPLSSKKDLERKPTKTPPNIDFTKLP